MTEFDTLHYLTAKDGEKIPYRTMAASDEEQGVVLISHGIAEHSLRHKHLTNQLSQAGFHVYSHDHRGHGANVTVKTPLGSPATKHTVLVSDMEVLRNQIDEAHKNLPVFIIGHSTGSSIALRHAQEYAKKPAGIAVISPYSPQKSELQFLKLLLAAERFRKGSDVPSMIMRKMTTQQWIGAVKNPRTDHDWLCNDREVVDTYIQDPLCGFTPTIGMWLDIVALTQASMKNHNLSQLPPDLPLYLAGGSQDSVTIGSKSLGLTARRLIRKGFKQVSLQIWPQMRHDIFNEIDNKKVADHLISWLDKRANDYQLLDMK